MTTNAVMDTILETLEKHLTTKTVFGEAVTVGDVTMLPVMDLAFGFGGGGGEGRDEKNNGTGVGSGGGAGARLTPKALVVIKGGEVQVIPMAKGGAIDKIVEALPAIMEKFQGMSVKAEKKAEEPAE